MDGYTRRPHTYADIALGHGQHRKRENQPDIDDSHYKNDITSNGSLPSRLEYPNVTMCTLVRFRVRS